MKQDLAELPQVQKLFDAPPEQFTAERDAVVKALVTGGDSEHARAVKALRKPPLSVWAVNRLAREHAREIEGLFDAADRVRKLQSQAMAESASSDLAKGTHEVQGQVWKLVQLSKPMLEAVGSTLNPSIERRIQTTLQAASLLPGDEREDVRRGTLEKDLTPVTFTELLSRLPAAEPRKTSSHGAKSEQVDPKSERFAEAGRELKGAEAHLQQLEREFHAADEEWTRSKEATEQAERTAASLQERTRALGRELQAKREQTTQAGSRLVAARKKLERLSRKPEGK